MDGDAPHWMNSYSAARGGYDLSKTRLQMQEYRMRARFMIALLSFQLESSLVSNRSVYFAYGLCDIGA